MQRQQVEREDPAPAGPAPVALGEEAGVRGLYPPAGGGAEVDDGQPWAEEVGLLLQLEQLEC